MLKFWIATGVVAVLLAQSDTAPKTDVKAVVDDYHGVKVTDPYRWLENWNDPEVRLWSDHQNAYAHSRLDTPSSSAMSDSKPRSLSTHAPVSAIPSIRSGVVPTRGAIDSKFCRR